MIRKLRLENFRGVKSGEVELEKLTVIVGGNNSGKTTILEALFLAPNPLRRVPYSHCAASTLHDLHRTLNSTGYAFLLYRYVSEEATIEWNDSYLKMVVDDKIYLTSNKLPENVGSEIRIRDRVVRYFGTLELQRNAWSGNSRVLLTPNSLLISSELVKLAQEFIHQNWVQLANTGILSRVVRDISELVHEDYINMTIEPYLGGTLSIFALRSDGTRIRLGDLGAGAQLYVMSKILYEFYAPQILLFDDVESHMNPRLLVSLAEWFSDLVEVGVQIVVTTHSLEAARMLVEVAGAGILLVSLEDGEMKFTKISRDELEDLVSAGVDVRIAEGVLL